ncbi:MAG: hypothetical protein EBT04_03910 [Betaproteobacteria bacterium]|jgi:hypothetical protein|nr:hypothetical protein [Betaproteobacteria bacterium]
MIDRLLPRADDPYSGSRWSLGFLILVTVMSTARSLIHLLAPDGGAHTIAGITLDVAGGPNIVALFGQWGASQLVLACLQWVVVLRYRFLVPAMLAIIVLEQLLRILAGRLKPLILDSPPPGAYGTYVVLGLALIFLAIELRHHPRS